MISSFCSSVQCTSVSPECPNSGSKFSISALEISITCRFFAPVTGDRSFTRLKLTDRKFNEGNCSIPSNEEICVVNASVSSCHPFNGFRFSSMVLSPHMNSAFNVLICERVSAAASFTSHMHRVFSFFISVNGSNILFSTSTLLISR